MDEWLEKQIEQLIQYRDAELVRYEVYELFEAMVGECDDEE